MAWSYPEIALQDLMELIKNFIDMLNLASGYQSTGRLAHWDSHNVKKSFEWAVFLENVWKGLTSSRDYEASVKELDSSLTELKSNPSYPQGLAHLSCSTLGKAREFLFERFIQTFPLRESHLRAIVRASVQMDFSLIERADGDCIDAYLEKLMRIPSQSMNISEGSNFQVDPKFPVDVPSGKPHNLVDGDFSMLAIQQLRRRQLAVSCISVTENGLEQLFKSIGQSMDDGLGNASNSETIKQLGCVKKPPLEPVVWSHWRSRSLSYMLHKRTTRLVSGASLICSAPEDKCIQMFERLKVSAESDDHLLEMVEILLLGFVADRWTTLIEHLMSVSYESLPVSRLCQEVFNLPQEKPLNICFQEGLMNPKGPDYVGCLEVFLSNHLDQLLKLSPVLAAVAIPSRPQLFRSYLREIQGQFHSFPTKSCNCIADGMEHRECELAERVWCLYIFYICRSDAAFRRTTTT